MLRILRAIAIVIGLVLVVLVGAFFAIGGMQIVTALQGAKLPSEQFAATPAGDLAYLRTVVLANEHGATPEQVAAFTATIDAAPPPQTADDFTLVALRALASFDNAHSTLTGPVMRRLPIRLHWTADALIVVKARPEQAALLGRRILSIGGKTPEEMLATMPQLVGGGTPGWVRYRSEYFYVAPAALAFLGATTQDGAVELRTLTPEGVEETLMLTADADHMPSDPFWDFRNAFPDDPSFGTDGWVTLLHSGPSLPLYLRDTHRLYALEAQPEHQAVYLRMNGSINDDDETVEAFTQRALALVQTSAPANIVVDFRFNRGGDYTMLLPLVQGLSAAVPSNGRLYLITGPNTFSAGILAASQFKRYIPNRLVVVGEEVGDRLRFRGEGLILNTPTTNAEIYMGTAWDDAETDCGWFGDCWPPNKFLLRGVGDLEPNIPVANTWASYRGGDDLALDAIWADIAQR